MAVLSLDPGRIPSSPVADHRNPCEDDRISSVILRPGSAAKQEQQMTVITGQSDPLLPGEGQLSLSSIHSWETLDHSQSLSGSAGETQTPCTDLLIVAVSSFLELCHSFDFQLWIQGRAEFGMYEGQN